MKILFKRHWPLFGVGALLVLVLVFLARSGKEIVKTTALIKNIVSGEGIELKDVQYRQDDPDDKIKWVLDAGEVRFSEDMKTIRFFDFKLRIEPEGRPRFELTGKRGKYIKDSGKIELWGNLKGLYGGKYEIVTDYALINEKSGIIKTGKPVRITGPSFSVEGKGLVADMEREQVKILSEVHTRIDNKESMIQ